MAYVKVAERRRIHEGGFDEFWKEYPRKVSRKKAFDRWVALDPKPELVVEIIEALKKYKETDQWKRDGGEYIPYASTFIFQRRWEDDIPAPKTDKSTKAVANARGAESFLKTVVVIKSDQ